MKISLIGYGYWGRNIARTLKEEGYEFIIFDEDKTQINEAKKLYEFKEFNSYEDILQDDGIEAIFIATPPKTHYHLAKKALLNNKHIFVEKPFCLSLDEAYELIELAEKKSLIYMVDHIFIYSEPVKFIKNSLDSLGDVIYINSRRINLGLFQYTTDVIWDLAVHDLSIIDYLVGLDIKKVSVFKRKYKNFPNEALANINLELNSGITVSINVSWLSPIKVREMIIGGSKKTIVYNDVEKEKIKIYDAGVLLEENLENRAYEYLIKYHLGDVEIPKLSGNMSLNNSINNFFESIKEKKLPITSKESIINVTKALEIISKV